MYDKMINELQKSMALLKKQGYNPSIKALVWIQGESDATRNFADGYGRRLELLVNDFRNNVAHDNKLPIVLGLDEQHPWVRNFPTVIDSQKKLVKSDPNIIFTSMIGLEKADVTHLTPKGLNKHGERLYDAYKKLINEDDIP